VTDWRTAPGIVPPHSTVTVNLDPPPGPNERVLVGYREPLTGSLCIEEGLVVHNPTDGHLIYVVVVMPQAFAAAAQAPWGQLLANARNQFGQIGSFASAVRSFCGAALDAIRRRREP
jgi:hypothetical protein